MYVNSYIDNDFTEIKRQIEGIYRLCGYKVGWLEVTLVVWIVRWLVGWMNGCLGR